MPAKRIVLSVTKIVAGIAALVFLLAPVSSVVGIILFIVAIAVLILCFAVGSSLHEKKTGYWPDEPNL